MSPDDSASLAPRPEPEASRPDLTPLNRVAQVDRPHLDHARIAAAWSPASFQCRASPAHSKASSEPPSLDASSALAAAA